MPGQMIGRIRHEDDSTFQEFSMMRRSVFACFAAGLIASLAFAAPSQAGTIVTTTINFTGLDPAASSVVIDYAGAGVISDVTPVFGIPTGATEAISAPNQVTVTFASSTAGPEAVAFTFASTTPFGNGTQPAITLTSATASGGQTVGTTLSFSQSAIPEPASIALLGIGMTGFLAFRRLFKRTSVA
jgi:hypothetical protein